MCGITGELSAGEIDPAAFYRAHALISHRGPDDEGFAAREAGGEVVELRGERTHGSWRRLAEVREAGPLRWILGHHRLSVIDLTENGHGPFGSEDGRLWLTYNGEVYNYLELRAELERAGHRFRSRTDTEVVLAAYREWGLDCFHRFNGMWGLAIVDLERERLLLCRDRFGVKPLYWHADDDGLVFGSEIPFLLARRRFGPNHEACAEFLATGRVDHGAATVLGGLRALAPGHLLISGLDGAAPRIERWWRLEPADGTPPSSIEDAAARFSELFESAVSVRMRSDVPVGALLSGGLDSTSIVRNLHHRGLLPADGLHTFSAVYREAEYSEGSLIEHTIAASPGVQAHLVEPPTERLADDVDDLIAQHGEPIRSLAVYAQHAVYGRVREVSPAVVLLNGQGADELFAGYTLERLWLIADQLRRGRLGRAVAEARWLRANAHMGATIALLRGLRRLLAVRRARGGIRRVRLRPPLFSTELELSEPLEGSDPLAARLRACLGHSPLPEYLRYEDRNSMAFSLETRLPFLDYRLAEWAIGLDPDHLLRGDESKRVVRRAVAAYVPEAIAGDRRKRGFTVPQEEWQRARLTRWIERGVEAAAEWPFLDPEAVHSGYRSYRDGGGDPWLWFRLGALAAWRELVVR